MARLPLGTSDFLKIRRSGALYVDKTALVSALVGGSAEVTLFCRPRRFGKTVMLSTLRYFLERAEEDLSDIFSGLAVWDDAEARQHFQRHPVVYLTFKDVKGTTWEEACGMLRSQLRLECRRLQWLADSVRLPLREQREFQRLLDDQATQDDWQFLLINLTTWLRTATGEPVVVLIDEYDTPIHTAWAHGFYEKMTGFLRVFLGSGLKDNPHLYMGVVTGILRVAKEGMFSGLNNLDVDSVLDHRHGEAFGFLEAEVDWLRREVDPAISLDVLRSWYNGYRVGAAMVYNPWSILKCLLEGGRPGPYWVNTGSTDAVADRIWDDATFLDDLELLLRGEVAKRRIPDTTALPGMGTAELRALLLHAGYFTTRSVERASNGWDVELVVPNKDAGAALGMVVDRWMAQAMPDASAVKLLLATMLDGRAERFGALLSDLVVRALSFHDVPRPDPERVFHAFVLGLLVNLEATHRVVSNRESGDGRADALVIPRVAGGVGVVLEFKRVDENGDLEMALDQALLQIAMGRYETALQEAGAGTIRRYGVVVAGKKVRVRAG